MSELARARFDALVNGLREPDPEALVETLWADFTPGCWPALFQALEVAADLPRFDHSGQRLDAEDAWPSLGGNPQAMLTARKLVTRPIVVPRSIEASAHRSVSSSMARDALQTDRCVHVGPLLPPHDRTKLEALVGYRTNEGWGQITREHEPELHAITDRFVACRAFRELSGFDPGRDDYTSTLSLQSLEPEGIAWHQDLYWPHEWVGQDVFSVLYALADDSPQRGGAFLLYSSRTNTLSHYYRKAHQSTILWNCRETSKRPFHAVSNYHSDSTKRPLLILQCRIRSREPLRGSSDRGR